MRINIKDYIKKIFKKELKQEFKRRQYKEEYYFKDKVDNANQHIRDLIDENDGNIIVKHGDYFDTKVRIEDIIWDFSAYNKNDLYVVVGMYGVSGAVFAGEYQEALDALADADLLKQFAVDEDYAMELEQEYDGEGLVRLGNAGEPFETEYMNVTKYKFEDLPEKTKEIFTYLLSDEEDEDEEY